MLFELNCNYHSNIYLDDEADLHSRSCFANELAKKLKNPMLIYQQIIFHI